MDTKRYFLHGDLNEEIYMEQPPKFKKNGIFIYRLKKSLCGLKQTPRAWYEKIDNCFSISICKCCEPYHSIYVLHVDDETLIVVVYVDDLVITRSKVNLTLGLKKQLVDTFQMINLGNLHFFLGIQIL